MSLSRVPATTSPRRWSFCTSVLAVTDALLEGPLDRGRLEIEADKQKAETHAPIDPFFLPLSRVKGSIDIYNKPGVETMPTASLCDILGIPFNERKAGAFKRINQIMATLHWHPIKVRDRRGLRASIIADICASSLTGRGMQNRRRS